MVRCLQRIGRPNNDSIRNGVGLRTDYKRITQYCNVLQTMKITRTSIFSQKTRTFDLDVTEEEYNAYKSGELIQVAMPRLNADEREFILTGHWDGEYDKMCDDLQEDGSYAKSSEDRS